MFTAGTIAMVLFVVVAWLVVTLFAAMFFRQVVGTNEVHTVQFRRKTISYGKDQAAGNVYYRWPAWVPRIGIRVIKLPVSVFDLQLQDYAAYDKGRVPFLVDIMAFFRISDPNCAAQRVASFTELQGQLRGILQGASRSILAQNPIEEILEQRAEYGLRFTEATNDQLKAWGVVNVKNIELMDIRDTKESKSIQNIMAMKQSLIERDSRVNVASNIQQAKTAEIAAQQIVLVRQQEAEELVGVRTAQKDQQIGINKQQAEQAVKEQERLTAEKTMAVLQVNQQRGAEIEKARGITQAEGELRQAELHADAAKAEGIGEGAAKQAVLMAPVNTQIELAKQIGENEGYQKYLISIKQIEISRDVGIAQAEALKAANIKVIANAGGVIDGVKSAMELLTPKGGLQLGATLEAFKETEVGKAVVERFTNGAGAHT